MNQKQYAPPTSLNLGGHNKYRMSNHFAISQLQISRGIHLVLLLLLHENVCCGYSLKCLIETLLMNTNSLCFLGKISVR